MGALEAFDPEAALAIKNTVRLTSAEFRQMLDLEELAGMTRDEYTQHAAAAALGVGGDAGWIFDAFQVGRASMRSGRHMAPRDMDWQTAVSDIRTA